MPRSRWTGILISTVVLSLSGTARSDEPKAPIQADVVLKGGTLVDGTGAPAKLADVALRGDRIVAVGTFDASPNAKLIDTSGLIVAPGFIDLHTHSDDGILKPANRPNLNYQTQGVTTVVTGNCGGGVVDVAKFLDAVDAHGTGTNVIHLVPLGSVRSAVFGNVDRPPTERELTQMKRVIDRGMRAGAWGVSSGLIYMPGLYAKTAELAELARVAARHGGFYASHIRDEGDGLLASIDEALTVGREAKLPVHISHLKASGRSSWGLVTPGCERIDEARKQGQAVTADQYPYIASSTRLAAMVIPAWALEGSTEDFTRIAADPVRGVQLRHEIDRELKARDGGAAIRIARYAPKLSRVGRDLVTIAREEGTTPLEIVLDVQRHGGAQAINFGMSEDDVRTVMHHDFVATASDGSSHVPNGEDRPHPRAYGTFPRKVRYALDDKVLTLEQAIRSCSGLPAQILRLPDRGVIRTGAIADIVVFDPKTFRDAATFDHPTRYAPGVRYLYVNGVAAIAQGKPLKVLPGRALRLNRDGPAELIVKAGRIWTGNREQPWAEAIAARGGAIVAVGSAADVLAFQGPQTRIVDRPDAFATPGLIDAHGHISSLGSGSEEIDLRGVKDLDEVARRVRAWIEAHPGDSWVVGSSRVDLQACKLEYSIVSPK